jgi:hypothetical protein
MPALAQTPVLPEATHEGALYNRPKELLIADPQLDLLGEGLDACVLEAVEQLSDRAAAARLGRSGRLTTGHRSREAHDRAIRRTGERR